MTAGRRLKWRDTALQLEAAPSVTGAPVSDGMIGIIRGPVATRGVRRQLALLASHNELFSCDPQSLVVNVRALHHTGHPRLAGSSELLVLNRGTDLSLYGASMKTCRIVSSAIPLVIDAVIMP
jgi:hypothetical protein